MTSEIIIMNTDVIALAADSTITINDKKTYNGVNKIFMLSNDPPMGIMVFGLGKFENISIETLIKEYSKKTDFKKLKNIINIKNDFLRYLTEVTQATNINIFLDSHLKNFKRLYYTKIFKVILYEYSNSKSVYLICYFLDESGIICSIVKI